MTAPFVFGKLALNKNFTNREAEIEQLKINFQSGINTILISPRRWGKSSLVLKASKEVEKQNKNIRIVHIDLQNTRNEEEFYRELLHNVMLAVSGKLEQVIENAKIFLRQWIPKISFTPDAQQEFSLGLDWEEVKKQPDEILNLAETMAKSKGIKIVICIDEFQNIGYFDNPLAFQKKIRSHWQKHQNTSYCLYGSKRHMLMDVFTSYSMPFYKFGTLMFLGKIPEDKWHPFIVKTFKNTGKKITKGRAIQIARLVENHPYYVQQLAQLTWLRTDQETTDENIEEAHESLTLQLSLLFQNLMESLTKNQINFLQAITENATMLSSKKTIKKYDLGTSANVARMKKALINREIIDDMGGPIFLLDPLFSNWLKKFYFK